MATCTWTGKSGTEYGYYFCKIGDDLSFFKGKPGNYIFTREDPLGSGTHFPIYIGEAQDLVVRLNLNSHEKVPCIMQNNATHIHIRTHEFSADTKHRKDEETDLRRKWNTPCNDQ